MIIVSAIKFWGVISYVPTLSNGDPVLYVCVCAYR